MIFTLLHTIEKLGLKGVMRWPNDLLIGEKKISGTLAETFDLGDHFGIALGLGVNVNMPLDVAKTVDRPTTSLQIELNRTFSLDEILHTITFSFAENLALFKLQGFRPFYPLSRCAPRL